MTHDQPDGPTQMTVWIESDDFEAVEAALKTNPTTKNPTVLAVLGERRLYRVDFTDLGRETDIFPGNSSTDRPFFGAADGFVPQRR